ncbi:MAG: sugar transferase [Clostridia bacterium]|nr:sugar transferase [Clostridia bacterium]
MRLASLSLAARRFGYFVKRRECSFYGFIKRALDIVFAILLLLILSPLFSVVILVLTVTTKGKPIFKQQRAGKLNKPFYIYKFRTMQIDAPPHMPTNDFSDANRYITKFGHFLRNTSIDELPQLWNILKGEMSFIGPRPVILAEAELLRERQKYKADTILPGLTGIAQLHGRDHVDIKHKARYDAYYVSHRTLFMDIRIVFLTVVCVITRRGIKDGSSKSDKPI